MVTQSIIILIFSVVTTGRIISMSNQKTDAICNEVIDKYIDRMHQLCDENRVADAISVYDEIRDWVIQKENLDCLILDYLEDC